MKPFNLGITVAAVICTASSLAPAADGADKAFADAMALQRAADSWSSYSDVGFRPADRPLVDKPGQVRVAWQGPHHMGVGKGSSSSVVGGGRELENPDESFYGGCASPIFAEGLVFCYYARPSGEEIDLSKVREGSRSNPPLFNKIRADDITVALDAVTGKLVWKAEEKGSGANIGGGKRDHWTNTPVYVGGKVVVLTPLGAMFAYDAKTGEKKWERPAPDRVRQRLDEAAAERRQVSTSGKESIGLKQTSMVAAERVVIEPTGSGLRGIDASTGKMLWERAEAKGQPWRAPFGKSTPAVWRHAGRQYVLINSGPALHLMDPTTGEQLWTKSTGGAQRTPVIVGDYVVWPVRPSRLAADDAKPGVWGAFKLSLTGAEVAWELPDELQYLAFYTDGGDRAGERNIIPGDGEVVLGLWGGKPGALDRDPGGLLINVVTGKVIARVPTDGFMRIGEGYNKWTGVQGYFVGPDLFVDHLDVSHADRFMVMRLHRIDRATGTIVTLGPVPARREMHYLGAYEVPHEIPAVDGRAYYRTLKGIACFDFAKAAAGG